MEYNNIIYECEYIYNNAYEERKCIFKQNRNKSGIYLWINNITKERYVGSSINISRRIRDYLNESFLKGGLKNKSLIYNALLSHSSANFSLYILEYCEPESLLEREQYYLDTLNTEYNILKTAGSLLGFKHSLRTRELIRKALTGRVCSESTRLKLSENIQSIPIKVINLSSGEITIVSSIKRAANYINIHPSYLSRVLIKKTFYKNKTYYIVKNTE